MSVVPPNTSDAGAVSLTSTTPLAHFAPLFGEQATVILSTVLSAALGSTHPECRWELHLSPASTPGREKLSQPLEWSCVLHENCFWFRGRLAVVDSGDVRVLTLEGTHGGARREGTRELVAVLRWIRRASSNDLRSH
jgi:hypothetical protein